jgi:glycosyltransferase involved in cell wall biosynthesis
MSKIPEASLARALDVLIERFHSLGEATDELRSLGQLDEIAGVSIRAPESLIARRCSHSASQWHLAQLLDAKASDAVRAEYHARWLAYLLQPGDPTRFPSTSIVIPVYNRRKLALEAIDSCLNQGPNVQIIVVDDGSTDGLEAAVEPVKERIIFHRKENGGVSSARNAGLKLATGMFVRFLDSDNLLYPDATRIFIEAFAAVPDADVCFSLDMNFDPRGYGGAWQLREPDGGPDCATTDLMRSGFPAYFSSIMLPRWLALTLPPFDETLPKSEDVRYWFGLGLWGAKVIALKQPLVERRRTPGSLTLERPEEGLCDEIVALANLTDTLSAVDKWPYLPDVLVRFEENDRWMRIESDSREKTITLRSDLLRDVQNLQILATSYSVSEMPPLMCLLAGLCDLEDRGHITDGASKYGYFAEVRRAIGAALHAAHPVTASDIVLWSNVPPPGKWWREVLSLLAAAPEIPVKDPKYSQCRQLLDNWAAAGSDEKKQAVDIERWRKILAKPFHSLRRLGLSGNRRRLEDYLAQLANVVGLAGAERLLRNRAMIGLLESATAAHSSMKHHLDQLKTLAEEFPEIPKRARVYLTAIRYHARWLAYLLAPGKADCLPRVLIVIDGGPEESNRSAVESAFSSFDHALETVNSSGRQQAAAINLALARHPTRELVVLLESNAVLSPTFLEKQIRNFADDPAREAIVTSNMVMISRNLVNRTGLLDEWLQHHAVARYLFRLGLAQADCAEAALARLKQSLTADHKGRHASELAAVVLYNLADAVETEALWSTIANSWGILGVPQAFEAVEAGGDKYLLRAKAAFFESLNAVAAANLLPLMFNLVGVSLARSQLASREELLFVLDELDRKIFQAWKQADDLQAEDN